MQKYGLTDNLKTVAFNFFNAHGKLFTIVTKCYDLTSSRNIFLEPIREMINAKKYKDVSILDNFGLNQDQDQEICT